MDLMRMTLSDLMCEPDGYQRTSAVDSFGMTEPIVSAAIGDAFWHLADSYVMHKLTSGAGDAAILNCGVLAGFYLGQSLAVKDAEAGKQLGSALVIATAPWRGTPTKRIMTDAGDKALRRAWRIANRQCGVKPWWNEVARPRRCWVRAVDSDGNVRTFDTDSSYWSAETERSYRESGFDVTPGTRSWDEIGLV